MTVLLDPESTPTIDVVAGGKVLGLGRRAAYEQANRYLDTGGAEGLPVIRIGHKLRVPVADLRRMVGLPLRPEREEGIDPTADALADLPPTLPDERMINDQCRSA